jgi:hypothetical protein
VVTDCPSVELVSKLHELLLEHKTNAVHLSHAPSLTKVLAIQEAKVFNQVVGCCRFALQHRASSLPQLEPAYLGLQGLLAEARAAYLYLLAKTHLGCAEVEVHNAKAVHEAVGMAVAFRSAYEKDLTPAGREGLVDPVDVTLLRIQMHRVYGQHLSCMGKFSAAQEVFQMEPDLQREELTAKRLRAFDKSPVSLLPVSLPTLGVQPLTLGLSPIQSPFALRVWAPSAQAPDQDANVKPSAPCPSPSASEQQ